YRKAAEQGDAGAQCNLGLMYANGQGVVQDDQQAAAWFRKAAEQGYADAQCNLGVMYAEGRGVPQDALQATLSAWGERVQWADRLPDQIQGVVVGNEVLDAMPVQLLVRHGRAQDGAWHERGVALDESQGGFMWQDRPTPLRPPVEIAGPHDYLTEIHPQAEAFMRTLARHLVRGAAFLIDYGFGEDEYYHPQRHMGTLVCHRAHQVDSDPLADVGLKDITAHVNFTAMALAAQDAGLQVLGYTTQAHFLINCGLLSELEQLTQAQRAQAAKLMMEHEMGELFKVLAVGAGQPWQPMGFAQGDRTHRL
ncbi:TPA: SAM-dependent methyltransferase, partial [Enterobacter kobei]|nr:SAM-dependent methyltransferase [Enterobacter kobei]